MPWPEYSAAFAPGLTDPQCPAPADVVAHGGKGVVRRYNVYRNNVTVSLIQALADIYPAVQRITGAEFFRAMARFHVRATPPTSPLLFEYGRDFPAFIAAYEYAQALPWLADVACIERAWLDAYHAADRPALDAGALAAIDPARLMALRFAPHPAARIVRSRHPAITFFTMNQAEGVPAPLHAHDAEDALITRPGPDVIVSRLPAGGAVFLTRLLAGDPLGAATAAAFDEAPSFDLGANLAGMISAGVFTTLQPGEPA
ncbi:DNA-binding domain-containing protein [Ottowia pentelensis]|uniref:DNA-binding domain-containing protein n=1 Tax=Ottowia pentelensis TaxID=511108 RepID=A0ABV6PXD0_9BURK